MQDVMVDQIEEAKQDLALHLLKEAEANEEINIRNIDNWDIAL